MPDQPFDQNLRITGHDVAFLNYAISVNHAHMGGLVTHIQTGILRYRSPPTLKRQGDFIPSRRVAKSITQCPTNKTMAPSRIDVRFSLIGEYPWTTGMTRQADA